MKGEIVVRVKNSVKFGNNFKSVTNIGTSIQNKIHEKLHKYMIREFLI